MNGYLNTLGLPALPDKISKENAAGKIGLENSPAIVGHAILSNEINKQNLSPKVK